MNGLVLYCDNVIEDADFNFPTIQVFASSVVGSNSDGDNESQMSSQTEGAKKTVYYKVVGTLLDPEKNEKPVWVQDGLKVIRYL